MAITNDDVGLKLLVLQKNFVEGQALTVFAKCRIVMSNIEVLLGTREIPSRES